MTDSPGALRLWPYLLGIAIGLCTGFALFVYLGARNIDDRTRAWVVDELSARFNGGVELQSLHVNLTPRMQVSGEGLTLRYRHRTDVPPLLRIEHSSFIWALRGLFPVRRRIKGFYVKNFLTTIPPRQRDPNQ